MDPRALRFTLFLSLCLAPLRASALDISGKVVDKLGAPVAGARVCEEAEPEHCVLTDANGEFRLSESVALRATRGSGRMGLSRNGGALVLRSPAAATVILAWHDPAGRSLAPPRASALVAGDNRLLPPEGLARGGVRFLRAQAAEPAGPGPISPPAAAARTAKRAIASSDLLITREGYRPGEYRPRRETETGAVIVLAQASDTGITYLSTFRSRVLSASDGRLVSESRRDSCQGTTKVTVTRRDTTLFAIRDGELIRWLPGRCSGEEFRGGPAGLFGTWTMIEADFPLPADLRPPGCSLDTLSSAPLPPTVRQTLVLADTAQVISLSVEVCPADLYISLVDRFLLRDSAITLSANTCRRAAWRNAAGEEAVLSFARKGRDSLSSSFAYKAAACAASEAISQGEGIPVDCTGNDPSFTFLDCIAGTGFFGDAPPPAGAAAARGPAR